MKRHTFAVLLSLIPLLGMSAYAATVTSSQSGNWSATTTWGGNPAPVAGDNVIIDGGFTVTVDVSNAACASVQLGGTLVGSGDGILAFAGGSRLTVAGLMTVGVGNRKGSITMASGGILTNEGLVLNGLGTWTPGTGTVEFTASNTLPNNGITSFIDYLPCPTQVPLKLLCRLPGEYPAHPRQAGNLQQRSRLTVHQRNLHWRAET